MRGGRSAQALGRWRAFGGVAVVLVLTAAVLGACSGSSSDAGSTTSTQRSTTSTSTSTSVDGGATGGPAAPSPPADTCAGIDGTTSWLDVAGVGRIQSATVGSGDTVAVFLHQSNRNGMCGFADYAQHLTEAGVRSILVNQCGYGETVCEDGGTVGTTWPKVALAAVAKARADGARRVVLVGASAGGTLAVVAAARPDATGVDGIVDLSGPLTYSDLDATAAAPSVRQQALVITAPGDGSGPTPAEATALVARLASSDKRVLVIADQPGVHGWDLLGVPGAWSPVADTVQQAVLGD